MINLAPSVTTIKPYEYLSLALQYQYHGMEVCEPNHSWGYGIKEYFELHMILSGQGTFIHNEKSWQLSCGDGFLITPGQLVRYEADEKNPWTYIWIGFNGNEAKSLLEHSGLSESVPVFFTSEGLDLHQCFIMLSELKTTDKYHGLLGQGFLCHILGYLMKESKANQELSIQIASQTRYVQEMITYVEKQYHQPIGVSHIAQHIGLERKYMSKLFKDEVGITLQNYLVQYRMEKALHLLKRSELTIRQVAYSVGYKDPLVFSKAFKRITAQTPSQLRVLTKIEGDD
jgi:AraC family transcriptional regulator, arabinose operon regulatory protein